jgi:DNA repair protein RecN (Recombination protein N)
MLRSLYVKNFILIDELHLELSSGLTVLTGETGAGKSILLGAVDAALGRRLPTKGLQKNKDEKAIIELVLDINADMQEDFARLELDFEPISTFRRELLPNGKSRCFVNDSPTKSKSLQEIAAHLIDINSQKDEGLIHRPLDQLELIDSFCDFGDLKQSYEHKYIEFRRVSLALDELQKLDQTDDLDYLKFIHQELNSKTINSQHYVELEDKILKARSIRNKQSAYESAVQIIGAENGLLDQLYSLEDVLQKSSDDEVLGQQSNLLEEVIAQIRMIEHTIEQGLTASISEAEFLALKDEKSGLDSLIRKHRVSTIQALEEKVIAIGEKIRLIETRESELERLSGIRLDLSKALETLANDLHAKRLLGASVIEEMLSVQLNRIDLPNARFALRWKKVNISSFGMYLPDFLFSANLGANLMPLNKSASGGEQSRVKLALKAVLGQRKHLSTQIFDEIDSGIGGSTAEKVGDLMKEMSVNQQIITITHLPQVAAKGDVHLLVSKSHNKESTYSNVVPLTQKNRKSEIARMLSGEIITDTALKQAKTLLDSQQE